MYRHYSIQVFPFGDLRVFACLRLVVAFRSLPRPSSALSAKASTVCPYSLDLCSTSFLMRTFFYPYINTANVFMQASSHIFFSCKETVFLNLLGWKLFLPFTEKLFHLYIVQFSKNLFEFTYC